MKTKTKLLFSFIALLICLFSFAVISYAKEITVGAEGCDYVKVDEATAAAESGDTIIIKSDIVNGTINVTKNLTYILEANWTNVGAGTNCVQGTTISIYARGGDRVFSVSSECALNNYSGNTNDFVWNFGSLDGHTLTIDAAKATRRLFYGYWNATLNLYDGAEITNAIQNTSRGEDNFIYFKTINIYDGAKIYGIWSNHKLLKATTLNMYGGEIYGNHTSSINGAIEVDNFNMFGGKIYNNYHTKTNSNHNVSFINVFSSINLYGGEIYGNYVKYGCANTNGIFGTHGYNNIALYMQDGMLHDNFVVDSITVTLNEETGVYEASDIVVREDSKQYNRHIVTNYAYTVFFKNANGSIVDALMINEDGTLAKAYSGKTEVLVPDGSWALEINSCKSVIPDTTKAGTYYVAIAHTPKDDDFDCTTVLLCLACDEVIYEAKEHNIMESLVYENFCANGIYICDCTNDGCTVNDVTDEEYAPLFTMLGYSVTKTALGTNGVGMVQGFYANKTAIKKYETVNGVTVSFGVVAVSKANVSGNPLELVDGAVTVVNEKVLTYNNDKSGNDAVVIKITGIDPENETHINTPLIWCGYISDGKTIKYIDNGNTYENAQAMSYSEILAQQTVNN